MLVGAAVALAVGSHQPRAQFESPAEVVVGQRPAGLGCYLGRPAEPGDEPPGPVGRREREQIRLVAVEPAAEPGVDLPHVVLGQAVVLLGEVGALEPLRQLHETHEIAQRQPAVDPADRLVPHELDGVAGVGQRRLDLVGSGKGRTVGADEVAGGEVDDLVEPGQQDPSGRGTPRPGWRTR